jgi:hypothetical protein
MRFLLRIFALLLTSLLAPPLWAADDLASGQAVFAPFDGGAIHISGRANLTLTPKGDRWWVSDGDRPRLAASEGVDTLRELLEGLRTVRTLGRHGRVKSGAFDNPTVVRWGDQQAEYGAKSRIPGLVYLRLPNGEVHLSHPLSELPETSALVDRRLFPDGMFTMDSINFEGPRGLLHVTKKFGVWRLTVPEPAASAEGVVDAWLAQLSALTGDPVADVSSMKGAVQATFTGADGQAFSLGLRGDGLVSMGGEVYQIDPVDRPLVPQRFRWMDKEILSLKASTVTGMQVRVGEVVHSFSQVESGKWVEKDTGKVYRSWVSDLFGLLAPLTAIDLWEKDKSMLGEAQREVRLWREDTVLASIELWQDDDKRWWARAGESIAVFEIEPELANHVGRLF